MHEFAHTHRIDCFGEAHGVRGMTANELADQLEGIARVQKPWPEYLRMALFKGGSPKHKPKASKSLSQILRGEEKAKLKS